MYAINRFFFFVCLMKNDKSMWKSDKCLFFFVFFENYLKANISWNKEICLETDDFGNT